MSSRKNLGRHRAPVTSTRPSAGPSRTVTGRTGGLGRQAAVIAAASGLVLTSGVAAQAAEAPQQRDAEPTSNLEVSSQAPAQFAADSAVTISYERPAVATAPAPVVEPPVEAAPVAAAPEAAPAKAKISVQAAAAAPAAAPGGSVNATMLSAAYAQIGMSQDCTALVEKALGAAGIPVGDLAPMQFMNYGSVVSDPQPGDMVVQSGHVAIYAGDGQVISSGINGNQTAVHPLSWLTASGSVTFVRAGA
jgi:cell wall-associated NlpC family hydrolase